MVLQQIGKIHDHQYQVLLCTFIRNLSYVPQNVLHAPDYFRILSGFFEGIPRNVWRHSSECLGHSPYSPHFVPRSCIPGFIAVVLIL